MSQFINFATGSSSPANENTSLEALGWGSSDAGTGVLSGLANIKGLDVDLGTTTADWAGLTFWVGPNTGNNRVLFQFRLAGGAWSDDLYAKPSIDGTTGAWVGVPLPLNVAAGTLIEVRAQTPNNAITTPFAVQGVIRTANSPPLFNSMVSLLAADTAATRISSTSLTEISAQAWTKLIDPTAQDYGAFIASVGDPTAAPTSNKKGTLRLALGGSGSEVEFGRQPWLASTTNPLVRTSPYVVMPKAAAAGSRISGALMTASPDTDAALVGLWGFR